MKRFLGLVVLLALTTGAIAQIAGTGSIGPSFGRRVDDFIAGRSSGGGSPVTGCTTGDQLDFSDATGCNLAQYVVRW